MMAKNKNMHYHSYMVKHWADKKLTVIKLSPLGGISDNKKRVLPKGNKDWDNRGWQEDGAWVEPASEEPY
eukprot:16433500-Heterocapsa_arctica.AAC.1